MIRISPIRLIGPKNEQIGVIETHEAMRMAEEAGLDLVEVVSDSRPPVCKIMDYGKHKYELSKKKQPSSKGNELKEIRLGRSIKIDKHDIKIRTDQARRFIMDGHKVQVIQRFKGREFAHKDIGLANLRRFFEALEDIAKVEQPPKPFGRQFTMLLSPDKPRVESARNRLAKQAEADLAEEQARLDAEIAELDARDAAEVTNDDAEGEPVEQVAKTKKGKQRDKRAGNPIDDEIAELLGE
ncbi:MAG: translation initiation factor IF-3 [Phycisphaera sp.]|nr:MAG: translation initiation factor IF-3 [Phycisphaera sp.]